MIVAVLLAGSNKKDALLTEQGVASKAELNIAGKPLVQYVLEAVRNSKSIDKVIYLGQHVEVLDSFYDKYLEASNDITTNMQNGLRAALKYDPATIVVVSGDLLWLTGEDIDTFIQTSKQEVPDASLVYPIMTRAMVEESFDQAHRRYAKLNGEELTGGSVLFLKPDCVEPLLDYADRAYKSRKNLLALAQLLGLSVMVKFVLRRLTVKDVETRISEGLGVLVQSLRVALPSLAMDVDEAEDLLCAERDMAEKEVEKDMQAKK